jgi:hypothetical protein
MATISQRISIEGGDDIRKQLEALAKAASSAFAQIEDAASKAQIDPQTQKAVDGLVAAFGDLTQASAKTAPPLEQVGEAATAAGEGLGKAAEESAKAAEGIAKTGDAAEKSSTSYANLALNVVRTGAAVGSAAASVASAGTATAALGVQAVTAAAAVGTFALSLGSVFVGAIGAAVAGLGILAAALERIAFDDARLSDTLDHLATKTRDIGQSFTDLQVGQQAFGQIGISAEKFRSVIANIAKELEGFKPGEAFEASANKIRGATIELLEAEKALLQVQIAKSAFSGDAERRVQEVERLLEVAKKTDDLADAEKRLAKAREDSAKAAANNLTNIVVLMSQIAALGATPSPPTLFAFDSLVTAETKLTAIKVVLQDVANAGGDVGKSLLKIIANLPKEDAFKIGAALGFSETDVDRVRRYGVEVTKIDNLFEKIKAAGVLISPQTATTFEQMNESSQRLASAWERLKQAWASTIFSGAAASATTAIDNITARVVEFAAQVVESFNMLGSQLMTTLGQIVQGWMRLPEVLSAIFSTAKALLDAWVTTPVSSAWQWIVDTFTSVVASLQSAADQAMAAITAFVTTPVASAWQWIVDMWNAMVAKLGFGGGAAAAPAGATGGSFAGGGLLGGRGTGTSDSNLAWVSRGEYITPARAVAQPGVLAFLEALRHSGGNLRDILDGMRGFALGGLVAPTLSIPAFAGGGTMNNVTINFPGLPEITGLRASSAVVDELRKAAAMAQVRSGGRKPSRYS